MGEAQLEYLVAMFGAKIRKNKFRLIQSETKSQTFLV